MKFLDLETQREVLGQRLSRRLEKVLQEGHFILGPEVYELEQTLAAWSNRKHCISCANGTDALQLALMALGIGPGDEVITPAFSFFATVETILLVGALPRFADIDENYFHIDVEHAAGLVNSRTKAIIPVSLFGQIPDTEALTKNFHGSSVAIIEDAAQSFGAKAQNQKSCGWSNLATTSFFPSKPLGCYGDGGALFTDNDIWSDRLKRLRSHGQSIRYQHDEVGINSRLDTLQAAILLAKLEIFKEELESRNQVALTYQELLNPLEVSRAIILPHLRDGHQSAWAQYTIRVKNRDRLVQYLQSKKIPYTIHYPKALHQQKAVTDLGLSAKCPVAEQMAQEVLSLPMHPYLKQDEQKTVAKALYDFYENEKDDATFLQSMRSL